METTQSILRTGAYTKGWEIYNILSKPAIQMLLLFIEQNPDCSPKQILELANLGTSRSRISQMLKELHEIDVIIINPRSNTSKIKLATERIQDINNSIARLL